MVPVALTVAGSDPSGGAGIQADLKTFHQHRVYGASAITLLTVQNTQGVAEVVPLDPRLVAAQIVAVLDDVPPAAAKTGALGSAEVVDAVATSLRDRSFPLVVDPVMISKHGAALLDARARQALIGRLLPLCTLVTPNAHEAAALAGMPEVRTVEQAREAARIIADLGPSGVLVKGGHIEGDAVDVLLWEGALEDLHAPRVDTDRTHGTGCTYSAAITAWLARGADMAGAVGRAKHWLTMALRSAPAIGHGIGPVDHMAPVPGEGPDGGDPGV